jgi:hypothetical protein
MWKIVNYTMLIALFSASTMPVLASSFFVDIDTSSLAGTQASLNLAFDFIESDGAVNNTALISHFQTDGSFDTNLASSEGDVNGNLNNTVTLGDSFFFNEHLQPITLGNTLQFQLDTTNQFAEGAVVPDAFSFFILGTNGLPLFATTDATGADALFQLVLTGLGTGNLSVFTATGQPNPTWTVTNVPLPGAFGLMLLGCLSLFRRNRRPQPVLR